MTNPPPRRTRSQLPARLAALAMLAGAGGLCWLGATQAAGYIEDISNKQVTQVLRQGGFDWVSVKTDGLQVQLTGEAPSEALRSRAVAQAGSAVEQNRVVDDMTVKPREAIAAPAFSVEFLRNDKGVSLIGLVPADTDRKSIVAALSLSAGQGKVADLLEAADYPTPPGWREALDFGLAAVKALPRTKVSVSAGKVEITAITDSAEEKARIEADLTGKKPRSVTLVTDISAPRPVIAPFTLRFVIDDKGPRFDACAADTEDARTRILRAGTEAGVKGAPDCVLGLGVPTPDWAKAAVPAIQALAELGRGDVTLSNVDITLHAPASVKQEDFDKAIGRLQSALPDVFDLTANLDAPAVQEPDPATFTAHSPGDGTITLDGTITDDRMRETVESLARSRFSRVNSTLRSDPSVPDGWTIRAIGALEALADLESGMVTVSPDMVRLDGVSGSRTASDTAARILSRRLGEGARYELAIGYDRRLDPMLGLPSGTQCVDRLNNVMAESEIGFEPAKSEISGDPKATLARLTEAMDQCDDFQMEIGGHTDSQGSEDFNQKLSAGRAEAVLRAMAGAGINTANLTARGYGESHPVATNETDAGREANRRIEFRLLSEAPVTASAPKPAPVVSGVTIDQKAPTKPPPELEILPPLTTPLAQELISPADIPAADSEPDAPLDAEGAAKAEAEADAIAEEEAKRLPVWTPGPRTPRPQARPDDAPAMNDVSDGDGGNEGTDAGLVDDTETTE
ncbi:OmpA family protein [Paracoccus pacificus]|uniref:OmpA family protein n=1 Tax=Paracoccus pacificus TaxID=1463598 RepID=A0ABW4R8N1_9RHOB